MNKNSNILDNILGLLDFKDSNNLICSNITTVNNYKEYIFRKFIKAINIDGVYFIKNVPIICFKYLSNYDEQEIITLQNKVWNLGSVAILVVITDELVNVYSGYKANPSQNTKDILICSASINDLSDIVQNFSRINIDTGIFWNKYQSFFNNEEKIGYYLTYNFKELKKELLNTKIDINIVHNLITRLIIALYLQDNNLLEHYINKDKQLKENCILASLSNKTKLISLFKHIDYLWPSNPFNFTTSEANSITNVHLNIIKKALNNNGNYKFSLFKFNLLPIEYICNVFEEFLINNKKEITSYTPPALANVMLNEVLPIDNNNTTCKILDPACGCSIFLVNGLKRQIEKLLITSKKTNIEYNDFNNLLTNNIFGFDLKLDALKFTTCTLFLLMLEYIPSIIKEATIDFPKLIGKNLIHGDFFNAKTLLHKNKYDIIIGNPPWQSNYGEQAKMYLKKTGYPIGDKQISQIFLWQIGDFLNDNGQACVLMPSKGLLFNFNQKNIEFKELFFKTYSIKKIINLSVFSNQLFENSKFPAAIIHYTPEKKVKTSNTLYYSPKPSNKAWDYSILREDPSDIKTLPRQQILKSHNIWKLAYVGTTKDFLLLNYLEKNFEKLGDICNNRGWKYGEGFQLGGGDKNINKDMSNLLYIPAKSIYPFFVNKTDLCKLNESTFHRTRDFDLYKAPHTLVRGGQIFSTYIDYDAVFTHAVMSFSSTDINESIYLKLLAAYLNSSLVLYYLFLTSSTWCVERSDIHLAEYKTIPFVITNDKGLLNNISSTYDELSLIVSSNINNYDSLNEYKDAKNTLDNYIFDIFKLDSNQKQQILDINKYEITYFQEYSKNIKPNNPFNSISIPDINLLKSYLTKFCTTINNNLTNNKYKTTATIYTGNSPLTVLVFSIKPKTKITEYLDINTNHNDLQTLIKKLDKKVLNETKESLYTKRNIRIYDGETFYIVKPSETRYWTQSMAVSDADKNIKEILKGFK